MHSCSERKMMIWSLCLIFSLSYSILVFASPANHLCRPDQKDALWEFKNEFHSSGMAGNDKTQRWRNNTDCCSWGGISCDLKTGNVVELNLWNSSLNGSLRYNSGLFRLQHLQSLNLSSNNLAGILPDSIGNLKYLRVLKLSGCNLFGKIPSSLGNLSYLTHLDLDGNGFTGELPDSMGNLNQLTKLLLALSKLSGNFPHRLLNLSELTAINLRSNQLEGTLPSNMSSFSKLKYFDIGSNSFSRSVPSSLFMIPSLVHLDLKRNGFNGPLEIGNISSPSKLQYLSLGRNLLYGSIPGFISKLVGLSTLDLSFWNTGRGIVDFSIFLHLKSLAFLDLSRLNTKSMVDMSIFSHLTSLSLLHLSGNHLNISSTLHLPSPLGSLALASCNISEFPKFLQTQTSLYSLDISANQIKGQVPEWIWRLPGLGYADFSRNSFSGFDGPADVLQRNAMYMLDISSNTFQNPFPWLAKSMTFFSASGNRFSGEIPTTICELVSLDTLVLSNNNFSGSIPRCSENFSASISVLHLQNNSLYGGFPEEFISDKLISLDVGHNHFSGELPKSLINCTYLEFLNVEDNLFKGQVPEWLWRLPELKFVDFSRNSFRGFDGPADVFQRNTILMLDISFNTFQDPFPLLPKSIEIFLASDNRFSGEIPTTICELVSLDTLVLSNNNFSGSIPRCSENFNANISILHLQNNSLSGGFPQEFISDKLISLDVSHNHLSGELPKSLINCTYLEFLNVEDNLFNDMFPFWLRLLPNLQILVLRSNNFHGPISPPRVSLSFPKLRIFDISENSFTGVLPSDYFSGWTALSSSVVVKDLTRSRYLTLSRYLTGFRGKYPKSVDLMIKGLKMELVGILFTMYKIIDVSGNKLEGDIPESIRLLKELIVLNMSNNAFTGHIPPSLENLTNLQSLDLSRNRLSGEIPPELGKLTFIARMNFSCNSLEGPIPQGTQIQSQNSSSFA